jgi:hypothetical protein
MKKNWLYLIIAILWVCTNVFLLPFVIWTTGLIRPWYILKGLLPYHDFSWIRTPLDLYLLAAWYKLFGVSPLAYQLFVCVILILTVIFFYFIVHKLFPKYARIIYILFLSFLFPFFINAEEGELLVGLFALIGFFFLCLFISFQRKIHLFLLGVISGILVITKQNTAFFSGAGLVAITFDAMRQKMYFRTYIKRHLIFLSGILFPISLILIYFAQQGILNEMIYNTVNIILGSYQSAYRAAQRPQGDGLLMAAAYLCMLASYITLWKQIKLATEIKIAIGLYSITLLPSLLPSFLSYRAYTAFPAIAITVGIVLGTLKAQLLKLHPLRIIIVFFFLFTGMYMFSGYIKDYVAFVKDNGFHTNQYITDYGEIEFEIAHWIVANTSPNERIMCYGNDIIYLLSNRLPTNKHTDPYPFVLEPYEKTSPDFYNNPPTIIIFDETLPDMHIGLSSWPILQFLKKQYIPVQKFGETLTVYQYVKN